MTILERLASRDRQRGSLGRHSAMLGSLVVLLVALPLLEGTPGSGRRFPLLFCLVLFAAVYVHRTQRWTLWLAALLGAGAIVTLAIADSSGSSTARVASHLLGLGLLGLTTLLLLNSLVKAQEVEVDTLVGGICVYLLVGLCFALVYQLMIDLSPDALVSGGEVLGATIHDSSKMSARLLYFSFITLTTVGYGDITPHGEIAEMLSASEAIIGQLYLAIFIARMMGLHMGSSRARARDREVDSDTLHASARQGDERWG